MKFALLALVPAIVAAQNAPVKNSFGMEFVRIPAGSFIMGALTPACSPPRVEVSQEDYDACLKQAARDARPGVMVRISRPFYLGKFEVTQGEWRRVMGTNPSYHRAEGSERQPVENVSWADAQAFIGKLNARESTTMYRLPTEAEWEYAMRAGRTGERAEGKLADLAWFQSSSGGRTHAVGEKPPNAWGLYDMLGNVWEWCQDWYAPEWPLKPSIDPRGPAGGTMHVLKGGSALSHDKNLKLNVHAARTGTDLDVGFRVLRESK